MNKLLVLSISFIVLYSCSSGTQKNEVVNKDTMGLLLKDKQTVLKYDTILLNQISISGIPLLSNENIIFNEFEKPDSTKSENGDLEEGQTKKI